MLRHGAAIWHLWLFGLITVPAGFMIWHRLGVRFGLGESRGHVEAWAAYVSLGLFIAVFAMMFVFSPT